MLKMFLWGGMCYAIVRLVLFAACLNGHDHSCQSGSGISWVLCFVLGQELWIGFQGSGVHNIFFLCHTSSHAFLSMCPRCLSVHSSMSSKRWCCRLRAVQLKPVNCLTQSSARQISFICGSRIPVHTFVFIFHYKRLQKDSSEIKLLSKTKPCLDNEVGTIMSYR